MSRFELPKGVRDLDSILKEYRPKKWRGTESDRAYGDFKNPIDEGSTGYSREGDSVERSLAISYPVPFSPSTNSSTVNLRKHNDEPSHSRLDEIAEALRTLTYGEMLELAESLWKLNSQGSEITESDLPNVLYRWSTSRNFES